MRRGWAIVATILVVLVMVGIGVGAYNAGVDEGVRRAADAGQVIEVVGGRHGYGFFPGFFLFPLFLIGTFFLIGWAFRGPRRWGGHGHDHGPGFGPWSEEGRSRFEDKAREWHRHQHEQVSSGDEGGTSPPAS